MIAALQMLLDKIAAGDVQKEIDRRTGIPMSDRREQLAKLTTLPVVSK